MDYGNALMYGVNASIVSKLQRGTQDDSLSIAPSKLNCNLVRLLTLCFGAKPYVTITPPRQIQSLINKFIRFGT
jgi:hypothetical protein